MLYFINQRIQSSLSVFDVVYLTSLLEVRHICSLMTISPAMVLVVMSDKQNFHWTPWINIIHLSDITNTNLLLTIHYDSVMHNPGSPNTFFQGLLVVDQYQVLNIKNFLC